MYRCITGDALRVLRRFEDQSIDCIVTDPPYGIGLDYESCADDIALVDHVASNVLCEMRRVAKVVALTPGTNNVHRYPTPTWILAWVYERGSNMCRWGFNCWQPIFVYGKDPYLRDRLGGRPDIITKTNTKKFKTSHPCPKPLSFVLKLIERVSVRETDIIMDPFMGSGTTGVAAKQLGRSFIGSDINVRYVRIARQRIRST